MGAALTFLAGICSIARLSRRVTAPGGPKDVVNQLQEQREPMIITQNGGAKMVVQDIESYKKTQQTLALLKILALGQKQIETGQVVEVSKAIGQIRARRTDPD